MTRSKKGRRKCHSCAPGCKCEWCMGGVKRRAVRQAPLPHTPEDAFDIASELAINMAMKCCAAQDLAESRGEPYECTCLPLPGDMP